MYLFLLEQNRKRVGRGRRSGRPKEKRNIKTMDNPHTEQVREHMDRANGILKDNELENFVKRQLGYRKRLGKDAIEEGRALPVERATDASEKCKI